jgi:ribonuclease D
MASSLLMTEDAPFLALVERARGATEIALDCEFHGEKRYRPTLYLVQINVLDESVAVDASRVDLRPLGEILTDSRVRKLFHAGREDVRLLVKATGVSDVRGVFDTQVAAAFLGHGATIAYARLVKALLGVELDKGSQFTDWSRALSDDQIDYALNDVRHLPGVAHRLLAELENKGRVDWALEASQSMAQAALTEPDPRRLYRKVSGFASLSPVQLGMLRELAMWRDRTAASENCRPEGVASDPGLKQLALRPPTKHGQLRGMRGLGIGGAERYWPGLRDSLERGAAEPEPPVTIPETDVRVDSIITLLGAVRRVVAIEHDIAPELLATSAELRALAEWHLSGAEGPATVLEALADWRQALIARPLLDTLGGKIAVKVAASTASGLELTSA